MKIDDSDKSDTLKNNADKADTLKIASNLRYSFFMLRDQF